MCTHTTTRIDWTTQRGYTGSVESSDPNPAAHGSIEYVEQCCECGCERWVAANGEHHECGRWGESRAAVAAKQARETADDAARRDIAAAKAAGIASVTRRDDEYSVTFADGRVSAMARDVLVAACEQADVGLAAIYRGVRWLAR